MKKWKIIVLVVHSGEFSRDENEIEFFSYCKLSRNSSFTLCIRGAAARKCVFAPHRVNSKFEIMGRMEHGPFSLNSLCGHSVHKNGPAKERKDKETEGKRAQSTVKRKTGTKKGRAGEFCKKCCLKRSGFGSKSAVSGKFCSEIYDKNPTRCGLCHNTQHRRVA